MLFQFHVITVDPSLIFFGFNVACKLNFLAFILLLFLLHFGYNLRKMLLFSLSYSCILNQLSDGRSFDFFEGVNVLMEERGRCLQLRFSQGCRACLLFEQLNNILFRC